MDVQSVTSCSQRLIEVQRSTLPLKVERCVLVMMDAPHYHSDPPPSLSEVIGQWGG